MAFATGLGMMGLLRFDLPPDDRAEFIPLPD
jgi:hypothetical protein